ncbi:MAG: TetR/AcrR family transcriptional regulator [Clostridiales bacterium]|nr:TetR/AcrR family transcriptional regulator [Clostridiales bacterium]
MTEPTTGGKLSRKQQAEETRLLVFNTALSLLEERDFEEITIRDIVKAAGVSIGTFYNYFSSKLDVYYETYFLADAYFEEEVAPLLTQSTLRERLLFLFDRYAAYSSEITSMSLTKILYNSNNKHFMRQTDTGIIPVLTRTLQQGMDSGELVCEESATEIASFLMIAARGQVYDWCIHDGSYILREAMAGMIGKLLRIYL